MMLNWLYSYIFGEENLISIYIYIYRAGWVEFGIGLSIINILNIPILIASVPYIYFNYPLSELSQNLYMLVHLII